MTGAREVFNSRNVEKRGGGNRPMLSDLRESGEIEQASDIVNSIEELGKKIHFCQDLEDLVKRVLSKNNIELL